jgi:DNA repair photolyase
MYKYPLAITQQFRFCGNSFRIDMYKNCDFGCNYCFANTRKGAFTQFDDIADIKIIENYFEKAFSTKTYNDITVELIKNRVPLHLGGMSDPFQRRENEFKLTYKLLDLTKKYNYPVLISTKTGNISDDYFNVLNPKIHAFQISLISLNDTYIKQFENNTPSPLERISFIKKLKSLGFWVSVRIQPLISLDEAIELVKFLDKEKLVNYITIEHLKIPQDNKIITKFFKKFLKEGLKNYSSSFSMRNLELSSKIKKENILKLKKITDIPIGVGDNDLHYLSDSKCCCGIDCINKNFENYLKYNLTFFLKDDLTNTNIFIPKNDIRSSVSNHIRLTNEKNMKYYCDKYVYDHKDIIPESEILKIENFLKIKLKNTVFLW